MKQSGRYTAITLALIYLIFSIAGARPLFARVVSVQKDQVNIRRGAGVTTEVIGKAGKGMMFAWQGAEKDWTRIILSDGQAGYIRNDLLQGFDEIAVTGSGVRIRQNPSLQGAVLGKADKGDKLEVLDYQKDWFKVRFGQVSGWISADFVKPGAAVILPSAPDPGQTEQEGDDPGADQESQNGQTPDAAYNFDSVTVSGGDREGVLSGKIITLDPGHGTRGVGKPVDPGAQGVKIGIWEKDVNLDVALKLKTILEDMGATIWMTHTGVTELDLFGRAEVANRNGSDIFVSIHTNASEKPTLSGHSVYFYAPDDDGRLSGQRNARQALARFVQDSMIKTCGRDDLGIKESNFVVLRQTNCPSILVETAFLSNAQEELLLAQGAFRLRLADAIAIGILKYFGAA